MWFVTRFTVLLVFRSKALKTLALVALCLLGIAWVASGFSPRQPQTVALDVGISFIRLILPLLGILLVQELIVKEIERKTILSTLTYPKSRCAFLIGRYVGIAIVLWCMLCTLGLLLGVEVIALVAGYEQNMPPNLGWPYVLTMLLLGLDVMVILAFAVLLAAVSTTPNLVMLGGLGFMLVARSIGTALQILQASPQVLDQAQAYNSTLQHALYIFPDLGLLDIRSAALYGSLQMIKEPWWWLIFVPITYGAILLCLAVWRFSLRQFS